jgi:hypothetical protein
MCRREIGTTTSPTAPPLLVSTRNPAAPDPAITALPSGERWIQPPAFAS